jgi:hypothetical protein
MYSDLLRKFKASPDNEDIKSLLKLRELFICCVSLKYNPDYPKVIELLTGVKIETKDIIKLADKLLKDYKNEDKRIHNCMKTSNKSSFFGTLEE